MIEAPCQHVIFYPVSGTQLTIDQMYDDVFHLQQLSQVHVTRDPSE